METLIIQVDLRRYSRDGPPQLGITVEAPFSQRNALQQKKQQQHHHHQQQQQLQQRHQQLQDYQNHDYQNLDSDYYGPPGTRSNILTNSIPTNGRSNKNIPLVKRPSNPGAAANKTQQVHEGLQITQIQRGSVIDRTGQFRVGDIIVEVNGVNLQRPFPEAQKTLKQFVIDHTSHGLLILKVLRKCASSSSIPSTTGSQISVIERQPATPKVTGKTQISDNPATSSTSLPQSPLSSKSNSSRTSRHLVGALNTRKIGVRHTITLRKAANGFGLKIAERDNMHSRNRPIYVTAITTMGSAYKDGRLREGDMLLEVNGIDIQAQTQAAVTRMLKSIKTNEEVEFVVSRQEDLPVDESQEIHDESVSSARGMNSENNCDKSLIDLDVPDHDDSVFVEPISDVQFEKKIDSILNVPIIDGPGYYTYDIPLNDTRSAGLGLSLKYPCRADERRDLGIWIEKVITGGAAWKDGRLQPDDQILAINGIDLVDLSNAEASETLTAAVCRGVGPEASANTIRLKIHRRSPSVVAKILQGTNNQIECSNMVPKTKSAISDKSIEISRESFQTAFDNTLQVKASETRNTSDSSNQNSQSDSAMSPQTQASNSLKLTNSCYDRSSSDKTNDTTSSAISQITNSTNNVPNSELSSAAMDRSTNAKYSLSDQFITKKLANQKSDSLAATKPKSINTNHGPEAQNMDHETSSQSWDDESVDAVNSEDHFQRDGFGRQSISEKRHAQLSAQHTDTFRRNQRMREEREQQRLLDEQMSRQRIDDVANVNQPELHQTHSNGLNNGMTNGITNGMTNGMTNGLTPNLLPYIEIGAGMPSNCCHHQPTYIQQTPATIAVDQNHMFWHNVPYDPRQDQAYAPYCQSSAFIDPKSLNLINFTRQHQLHDHQMMPATHIQNEYGLYDPHQGGYYPNYVVSPIRRSNSFQLAVNHGQSPGASHKQHVAPSNPTYWDNANLPAQPAVQPKQSFRQLQHPMQAPVQPNPPRLSRHPYGVASNEASVSYADKLWTTNSQTDCDANQLERSMHSHIQPAQNNQMARDAYGPMSGTVTLDRRRRRRDCPNNGEPRNKGAAAVLRNAVALLRRPLSFGRSSQ